TQQSPDPAPASDRVGKFVRCNFRRGQAHRHRGARNLRPAAPVADPPELRLLARRASARPLARGSAVLGWIRGPRGRDWRMLVVLAGGAASRLWVGLSGREL